MTTREFLEILKSSDINILMEGDRLRCDAPQGVLTEALKEELSRRKPEILAFLRAGSAINTSLVPIQSKGALPPFFGIGGHNGDVFCYVRLAHHLGENQPFYAIQPPGIEGELTPQTRVPDLAAYYLGEMRRMVPKGPYRLGGYCAGGIVAFEVARQLRALGEEVRLLALFGTPCPTLYLLRNELRITSRYFRHRILHHLRAMTGSHSGNALGYLRDRIRGFSGEFLERSETALATEGEKDREATVAKATMKAVHSYRPGRYPGRIHLFLGGRLSMEQNYGNELDWERYADGNLQSIPALMDARAIPCSATLTRNSSRNVSGSVSRFPPAFLDNVPIWNTTWIFAFHRDHPPSGNEGDRTFLFGYCP